MKTSGYGRPSTSSAVTASHRIARGTVSGAHGSGAGGTRTTPDQRYRAMETITPSSASLAVVRPRGVPERLAVYQRRPNPDFVLGL